LYGIMRSTFINNAGDHLMAVNEQVKQMNDVVIRTATSQIQSGVSQYMGYIRDIDTLSVPLAQPINTSTYGKKLDLSTKIGL
jgi:hypothetical protein